jgi:hypothetical protein
VQCGTALHVSTHVPFGAVPRLALQVCEACMRWRAAVLRLSQILQPPFWKWSMSLIITYYDDSVVDLSIICAHGMCEEHVQDFTLDFLSR